MEKYIYLEKEVVELESPKEQFALDVLVGFSSKGLLLKAIR